MIKVNEEQIMIHLNFLNLQSLEHMSNMANLEKILKYKTAYDNLELYLEKLEAIIKIDNLINHYFDIVESDINIIKSYLFNLKLDKDNYKKRDKI